MDNRRDRQYNAIEMFQAQAQRSQSPEQVFDYLSVLRPAPRYAALRVLPVYHKGDFVLLLNKWVAKISFIHEWNSEALAFRFDADGQDQFRRSKRKNQSGVFVGIPGTQPNIYRLLTISYSKFWDAFVRKLVRASYPILGPMLLQQGELKTILLSLERQIGDDFIVEVSEYSGKEPRPSQISTRRIAKYDSTRSWTKSNIRDVFAQANERGHRLTSVAFNIFRKSTPRRGRIKSASGRLYKNGQVNTNSLYKEILDIMLPSIEELLSNRIQLLSGRGLRERKYDPAASLEIAYQTDVFSDPEELHSFSKVISKYPNATKAIFHANPYYHASIADVKDGSSIDIWVVSPRHIMLIPQAKSTPVAFSRLAAHIFDEFREGELREISENNE